MKKKSIPSPSRSAITKLFSTNKKQSTLPIVWGEPKIKVIDLTDYPPKDFSFKQLEKQMYAALEARSKAK